MGIKFRDDQDLKFLQFCDNDDLGILVDILKGPEGDERLSEELTQDEHFKACNGDYISIWDVIAGELQLFGGDSIMNITRGHGISYREVLTDVCDKLGVDYKGVDDITEIETRLLLKILEKTMEEMSEEERSEIVKALDLGVVDLTPGPIMLALQAAIKAGGFKSYQLAVIVANAVAKAILGRGLPMAANAALTRAIAAFAGPIGIAIGVVLAVPMVSGPAFRVTMPACIQVAYMRQKSMNKDHF